MNREPINKQNLSDAVAEKLREYIRSSDAPRSLKLPPEAVIGESMGVSRITVRRALSDLEQEGLIQRTHGRGTFINPNISKIKATITPGQDLHQLIRESGYESRNELISLETVPADLAAIVEVHKKGFGYDKEAGLTAELLSDPTAEPTVSLLALRDGEAVGHILFTRCRIAGAEVQQPLFYILAPLAVVPSCQKQGVGGLLIAEGLQLLRERGAKLVFVLGHKEYYPRHGFIPGAEKLGFPAPYPILEKHADYWMAQALTDDGFSGPKGRVVCADALNRPEHWRE